MSAQVTLHAIEKHGNKLPEVKARHIDPEGSDFISLYIEVDGVNVVIFLNDFQAVEHLGRQIIEASLHQRAIEEGEKEVA